MEIRVLEADWKAFEAVMGEKGGCGGCWCMLWRLPKRQMDTQKGEKNRLAMKAIFDDGGVPGLIAWDKNIPVGWIQIGKRSEFVRLESSRVLKPIDDQPVWSVSCFFIHNKYRKKGLSVTILNAACDYVKKKGGKILEGYPIETEKKNYPPVYAWVGLVGTFIGAGFVEVARGSEKRPIMRKIL